MRSLEELLNESAASHGHRCAGQVLGVRMAMAGCRAIGIDEPKGCKKLLVFVEIDRCATDALQTVTGCSLGKRTLKFLDYGKMAATFFNTETQMAVRVLARDDSRELASRYAPEAANPGEAQKRAYAVMPDGLLFSIQPTAMKVAEEDMPGFRGARVACEECGEGINLRRDLRVGGRVLCIPCAQRNRFGAGLTPVQPNVVLIVGYKKVGKTTLIERLIPELRSRAYRVATVKHHHSDFPAAVDSEGTDTWRHRHAGATSVVLATPTDLVLFDRAESEASLDQILSRLPRADIVLVEGFHQARRAKIEVLSCQNDNRLCCADENLVATVSLAPPGGRVPNFRPMDVKPLVDLVEREIIGKSTCSPQAERSRLKSPSVAPRFVQQL